MVCADVVQVCVLVNLCPKTVLTSVFLGAGTQFSPNDRFYDYVEFFLPPSLNICSMAVVEFSAELLQLGI